MNHLRYASTVPSMEIFSSASSSDFTVMSGTMLPASQRPQRTGALAYKKGMSAMWDAWGVRVPCTILQLDGAQVCQVKTVSKEGYSAIQVGIGERRPITVPNALRKHYGHLGIPIKRAVREFRVSPDALLTTGTIIHALHFVPGQYVDVRGTTIGKGFQGGMKRWGFKGLPASHGVSAAHRSIGSTGCRHDPGRVWRGKKMPGHMGVKSATAECLHVMKIDPALNTVWVRGCIPGHLNSLVEIRDARKRINPSVSLPMPTFIPEVHSAEALVQQQTTAYQLQQEKRLQLTKQIKPKASTSVNANVIETNAALRTPTPMIHAQSNTVSLQSSSIKDPIYRRYEPKM